jgi:hypothetical protein
VCPARRVPVDQRDRLVPHEDGVVWAELAVANNLCGARKGETDGRVVEHPDQTSRTNEARLGERLKQLLHDLTLDKRENLPATLVNPEKPWCAHEADILEVVQKRMREWRVLTRWSSHRVSDADDAGRAKPACQYNLMHSAYGERCPTGSRCRELSAALHQG